jgi:predicted extracellular nuclease
MRTSITGKRVFRNLKIISTLCFTASAITLTFKHQAVGGNLNDDPRYIKRASRAPIDWKMPVAENEIKIMTYNVENLFDAEHDAGKADYEFLPISHPLKSECAKQGPYKKQCEETDWTPEKVIMKLQQIRKVVEAQGSLPDMMALQEVENPAVVGLLAKELGYSSFVMTNSPDVRGVDVALLYNEDKVRLITHKEKSLSIPGLSTRNILMAHFSFIENPAIGTLAIFVNHWPSQEKSSLVRVQAAQVLKDFVNAEMGRKTNFHSVLLGDFNTIDADMPNPFHEVILNPAWSARFEDAQVIFEALRLRQTLQMPPASYFFKREGTWNRLDHLFLSKNLYDKVGVDVVADSFRIVAPEFITRAFEFYSSENHFYSSVLFGVPRPYNHDTKNPAVAGYSDHFPVTLKLKLSEVK